MDKAINYSNKRIIVATHFFVTGPAQNLEEYLIKNKAGELLSISHPLYSAGHPLCPRGEEMIGSKKRYFIKGILQKENIFKDYKWQPELLTYFKHILLNIFWVLLSSEKWNLFVGAGNLNAFSGIILQKLRKVKKTVYYVIDYVPQRFENKLVNIIYHWVEQYCAKNCTETWNLSPRMIEGREKFFGFDKKYRKTQFVVPEGVWFERQRRLPAEKVNKHWLVYLGGMNYRLGIQETIRAIPKIIKVVPDFKLITIGKGRCAEEFQNLAKELGVDDHIDFKGFILDHKEVEDILAQCVLGIATYSTEQGGEFFTFFADPGKTKIYMAAGVPVIMTDTFYNAREIADAKGGVIVEYTENSIAQAVIDLMTNEEKWREYRQGAINYIKNLDWNIIFFNNLQRILCR